MKRLAYVLMTVGVLVALISFNLDVTVGGSGFANLNMMAQRQNLLIVGCVGFLSGIVLFIGALQQGRSKTQSALPEQEHAEKSIEAISAKSKVIAFWAQRDVGRKLVLVSAPTLLLSFCFPWEVSSVSYSNGLYALPGGWIELSQAVIGLLLWAYPFIVSATRASINSNGLTFNSVVAAIWIGSVAYKSHDFHEAIAEQAAIYMENGVGFWLGLAASMILIAGIFKIAKDSSVTKDAEIAPEA